MVPVSSRCSTRFGSRFNHAQRCTWRSSRSQVGGRESLDARDRLLWTWLFAVMAPLASALHIVMAADTSGLKSRMSGREPTPTFRTQSDLSHSAPLMRRSHAMKAILPLFTIAYATVALLFAAAALAVMGFCGDGIVGRDWPS